MVDGPVEMVYEEYITILELATTNDGISIVVSLSPLYAKVALL